MIRDALLIIYGAAWLFVVVATQIRTGGVPVELWGVLGVGVGGILAVFRVEGNGKSKTTKDKERQEDET